MVEIYRPPVLRDFPNVTTDFENAEMNKSAANAFLATKTTLINEIVAFCEKTGADDNSSFGRGRHEGPRD